MRARRLVLLLVVLAAAAIPALALRSVCAGASCEEPSGAGRVPFCPLPDALKADLVAGFREGRSPDVLGVTEGATVLGGSDQEDAAVAWPSLGASRTTGVPIVFSGTGVDRSIDVPAGTGLDQIAPTIAEMIGLHRPHPSVRAGVAVNGLASGERPRLVLEVALQGVGTAELTGDRGRWPTLGSLLHRGSGTLDGTTGSLPLDPAATLTTIGTGGLPYQHGITGTFVRNDQGQVTRAWGKGAPLSVIAALPDDLDRSTGQASRIGLVANDPSERGLIGGNWYARHDADDVAIVQPGNEARAAERILSSGYGVDEVPDLLAVVLDAAPAGGPGIADTDRRLARIVTAADRASDGSLLVVVAGTGASGTTSGRKDVEVTSLVAGVERVVPGDAPIVAAAVPGGLFLDQRSLASEGITGDAAVHALLDATAPDGRRLMADAFQGFAVSFARYC